jgi:Uma2 family endonuclease
MATITEPLVSGEAEEQPYPITSEVYFQMVEQGLVPRDRRVFLWGGRLYEKMAKSKAHSAVQNAFLGALAKRIPAGFFVGAENPVRLDATHVPLPDVVVARGAPLDYYDTRYPEGPDVVMIIEVAVSSLPEDLGARRTRYAAALPLAVYVVADIPHRQVLVHATPFPADDPGGGGYRERSVVRPGEVLSLRVDEVELEAIPYEEVMR